MQVTVYEESTGTILRSLEVYDPNDAPLQAGAGESWLEGKSSPKLHKVVDGEIVDLTEAEKDALRPPITPEQVQAERRRRLALGFDYDFGDARGVHTLATTEKDMEGWDEVTQWANAMIAKGTPSETLLIATETGSATVTALEWQDVLATATAMRQPIWQASFWLQSQDPIPHDYATNEDYWP